MLKFADYFQTNYSSSGTPERYVKISIEIEGVGMFSTILNKNTKAVQCQRYALNQGERPSIRNYMGVLGKQGFHNSVNALSAGWGNIIDEDRHSLMTCANMLGKACRQFCVGRPITDSSIENEIAAHAAQVRNAVCDLFNGRTVPATPQTTPAQTTTPKTEEEWVRLEFSTLTQTDLAEIIRKINDEGNPEFGVVCNGRKYKVVRGTKGMELRTLQETFTAQPVQEQRKEQTIAPSVPRTLPQRRKTKKALMRDNTNLTEFVNGCYYNIIREVGNGFITIANDNGEERTVKRDRLNVLEVYDEAPQYA